ncbi:MAG TPA: endonuclease/exonuclease/phosphatase [Pseudoalteromonas sp.]|uniref:HAD family acid phosphatase n=1 Tax=Pseudoalteromonas sp. TAE56 TaxID=1938596 RepID=UPI0003FA6ECF|nr:HAD family acid phosphatase [Pseudoalteromonas sp. TAE56]HDY90579.1 endonuclease/exonuclease/phosphatase [Pseudoalteromonas sp.]
MNAFSLLTITCVATLSIGCTSTIPTKVVESSPNSEVVTSLQSVSQPLKVATWNVEHLAYPIDTGCRTRTPSEIAAMKAYAKNLGADIIALQEVGSKAALQQIFSEDDWQLIMSTRADSKAYTCRKTGALSTQQKVAFAVKKAIPVLNTAAIDKLALKRAGLRYGLQITVNTPNGPTDILNVHMKSGCFVDDYLKSDSPACKTYAQQVPILDNWIAKREATNTPYIVLGDFNHRISAPYNQLTRTLLSNERSTSITTNNLIGCQARYPAPIDHIIVGKMDAKNIAKSAQGHKYKNMDDEAMLSDHCAVSVSITDNENALSASVLWQTTSKEYQALTTYMYQQAQTAVTQLPRSATNWVAVMDVDETVLDNSAYQKQTELSGEGYTPNTWQAWVKSENATLVPGAKSFIEALYKQGGKVALVTNRDKANDVHTWNNLKAVGLPITVENTCLMGRSEADKTAVDGKHFINDKDLRRQQITQGSADCFAPKGMQNNWKQPQVIKFQVGDNIEDFSGITQESANIEALQPKLGKSLFLLPNPMYGSW